MSSANTGFFKFQGSIVFSVFLAFCAFLAPFSAFSEEAEHSTGAHAEEKAEPYKADEVILHHISDAHEWHFFTVGHTHVTLPLPVILYSKENGLDVFMSTAFKHAEGVHDHNAPKTYKNYVLYHEKVYFANAQGGVDLDEKNHPVNSKPLDLSITKNVASMLLSFLLLALVFISVAKAYSKRGVAAPKGLQGLIEPLVLFVRNDIVKPNMGKHADAFLPYMLTLFFFIWMNNLLGLLPGAANVTGNIAVTAVLAVITLVLTNINGNKHHWTHILWPPGVPLPVKFILIPVEVLGIFTKPFSLMIRLFANITAGHIIILSILGLIFMFGEGGKSMTGFAVAPASLLLSIFLYFLELLVAAIQAFIFTMLTSLFIGQAMEDHGSHHEEAHH